MSLVDEANNNNNNNNEEPMCRMTRYGEMNRIDYNMASCAQCYDYLSLVFANFEPKLMIDESDRRYLLDFNASRFNASSARDRELIRTGMNAGEYEKWRDCCDEASNCCSNVMQTSIPMGFYLFFVVFHTIYLDLIMINIDKNVVFFFKFLNDKCLVTFTS